ncbi:MAG: T9SS type A sorting domain-containing protein [Bacteroidetes bacterium]|nr:T9SS type A sorting domain-containing protein [Bacteroidota bacterium]
MNIIHLPVNYQAIMGIVLVFFLLAGNHIVSAQCCNFIDSGQALGADPTFGVSLGDLDGNGTQDAITIDAYNDIEIFFNNGNGIFTLNQTITPLNGQQDNFGVVLVDVDNDADLDAIVCPFYATSDLKIYKNNGSGTLTLFQSVPSNIYSRNLGTADLDGDGYIDIFLPATNSGQSKVFLNNGTGFFTYFSSVAVSGAQDVALTDVNGDGTIDAILATEYAGLGVQVLLNDGLGNFSNSGQSLGNTGDAYTCIVAGDLDKDGDNDFIAGGMYLSSLVFLNDGLGTFTVHDTLVNSNYDEHMKLVDYNYDSYPDLFVSTYGSDGLEVWKNEGEAFFTLCYQNASPMPSSYSHGFDVGLLNGDMFYDTFMGQFGSSGDLVFFGSPTFYNILNTASICQGESYTLPDGSIVNSSGLYQSLFLTSQGCDSIITTNLQVYYINIDVTVNQYTLTAFSTMCSYQWVDCDNGYSAINGAVNQSYTAVSSGNYAVIISQAGCSDTSVCYYIDVTGYNEVADIQAHIFPNPVTDQVRIELDKGYTSVNVSLYDAIGRIVLKQYFNSCNNITLPLYQVQNGIYTLQIQLPDGHLTRTRIVKQ